MQTFSPSRPLFPTARTLSACSQRPSFHNRSTSLQATNFHGESETMKKRLLLCFIAILLSCISAVAQQSQQQMQPLTFWYGYNVNPGKEDEFLDLVKTVGQPVRDKLMSDGVILAWGVQSSLLRVPGNSTHFIWYAVADYAGVEKVDSAMRAQIAKLTEEANKWRGSQERPEGRRGSNGAPRPTLGSDKSS